MHSPCTGESSQACFNGSCSIPLRRLLESHDPSPKSTSSVAASRHDFAVTTASSLFPSRQFTNHESLPSLSEAFSSFTEAYPQYSNTNQADQIRAQEYSHLSPSNHVCLDYIGIGLFSHTQQQSQYSSTTPTTSMSSPSSQQHSDQSVFPFFDITYKSVNLNSHLLYGGQESELESTITKRIMSSLNISEVDYHMVYTANRSSAFKLLAESYPFQSNQGLLTVYDYESEAVGAMTNSAQKKGAQVMEAEFSWPSLRIQSAKLRKMVISKRKKGKRGLFVFPLQSQVTGAQYSYLWMTIAQENGWHILLDACALGPKDRDTLGLSIFQPDFLIYSFYRIFGDNPSGFGCLFVKRSSASVLETSMIARSIGIMGLIPAKRPSQLPNNSSSKEIETQQMPKYGLQEDDLVISSSFSCPLSAQMKNVMAETSSSTQLKHDETGEICEPEVGEKQKGPQPSEILEKSTHDVQLVQTKNGAHGKSEIKCAGWEPSEVPSCSTHGMKSGEFEYREISGIQRNWNTLMNTEIMEEEHTHDVQHVKTETRTGGRLEVECRGLDHADSLGLILMSSRARYLINWLVNALMKLRHPHSENEVPLVRIYGPKIKFDRGPAVAFNVFDWKGEKVEPILVQKLADRSSISLGCGFIHQIWFSDKYEEDKHRVLEITSQEAVGSAGNKKKKNTNLGITVLTAALGFLTSFEDVYRLWAFIARFLDADYVEKERWRYTALNQKIIEV